MQCVQWMMIANSSQKLYSAEALGRHSFLKQQYKHMVPQPLQSHSSVCGFYTMYASFRLFKFRQTELIGAHDVNEFSFISNSIKISYFILFNAIVQVIQSVCYFRYSLVNFVNFIYKLFTKPQVKTVS